MLGGGGGGGGGAGGRGDRRQDGVCVLNVCFVYVYVYVCICAYQLAPVKNHGLIIFKIVFNMHALCYITQSRLLTVLRRGSRTWITLCILLWCPAKSSLNNM